MGILRCVKIYPVGTVVRLDCDYSEDDPHKVIGYKCMGGANYLIFEDGGSALAGRVAEILRN